MSPDLRPQTPMCWGGRSRRFCSSVMAQGSGLGWVCGPSIIKSNQGRGPQVVRTCPHTGKVTVGEIVHLSWELGSAHTWGQSTISQRGHLPVARYPGASFHLSPPPISPASLFFGWGHAYSGKFCGPLSEAHSVTPRGSEASAAGFVWFVCSLRIVQVLSLVESFKKATNELIYKIETELQV